MSYYGGDPGIDFDRFNADEEAALARLPICAECDKPIQDEDCYEINGELICPRCLEENHKKSTERYIHGDAWED